MRNASGETGDLLKKVFLLLNAHNVRELSEKYLKEDQKIVASKVLDYHDPKLVTNRVKKILKKIDARTLSKEERYERRLILWLWYHHAISYAVWGSKDTRLARRYSSRALKYQPKDHSNRITRLLYLLVRNRSAEAEKWAKTIKEETERKTALRLLKFYNEGGFFGK